MSRYIDADLLLSKMDGRYRQIINVVDDSLAEGFLAVDRLIKEQPTTDVKEVVRGKNVSELDSVDGFECSECGIILEDWFRVENDECDMDKSYCEYCFDFCPNCGADMREGVER